MYRRGGHNHYGRRIFHFFEIELSERSSKLKKTRHNQFFLTLGLEMSVLMNFADFLQLRACGSYTASKLTQVAEKKLTLNRLLSFVTYS